MKPAEGLLLLPGFGSIPGATAVCHSNGNAAAAAFACLSCLDLLLLLRCLRWFKRSAAPAGFPTTGRFKVAVWVLTTLLTLVSTYKVASIMPPAKTILVLFWMAATVVLRVLYAFFMRRIKGVLVVAARLWTNTRPDFGDTSHCGFKRVAPGSSTRALLKAAVWVLTTTTLLTLVFSFKVVAIWPVPVQIIVFGMAIVLQGLIAFFITHKEEEIKDNDDVAATATFWYKIRSAVASIVFSGLDLLVLFSRYLLLGRLWTEWRRRFLAMSSRVRAIRAHDPRDVAWSVARLILDSGANIHAVGNIWLLDAVQPYSPPRSVSLADGTTNLPILGNGLIERPGQFRIPNVDFVQGLQDGLISIPQLDRDHGLVSCFGNGICRIMMHDGTEVGGAFLSTDGSYVLRYLLVPAGP